jgi:hypothetical protein
MEIIDLDKQEKAEKKLTKPQHFEKDECIINFADGELVIKIASESDKEGHKAGCMYVCESIDRIEKFTESDSTYLRFVRKQEE